jgi:hypothetical protein
MQAYRERLHSSVDNRPMLKRRVFVGQLQFISLKITQQGHEKQFTCYLCQAYGLFVVYLTTLFSDSDYTVSNEGVICE